MGNSRKGSAKFVATFGMFSALAIGLSSSAAQRISAGPVVFESAAPVVRQNPFGALGSGDLNGDGHIDLVISGTNYVLALPGRGDATFREGPAIITTFTPGFEIADYSGDGKVDAVFSNGVLQALELTSADAYKQNIIDTSFGRGLVVMGRFFTNRVAPTILLSKFEIAAGDLNGDGHLDYVTSSNAPANVSVFLNTGGGFTNGVSYDMGAGEQTFSVALGDWDHDGDVDVAAANLKAAAVAVLFNDGKGAFSGLQTYAAGVSSPMGVVARDMDGDGSDDLLVRGFDGSLSLLVGRRDGSFVPGILLEAGATMPATLFAARALTVNDFNDDGAPDVAWIKQNEIRLLLNVSPPRLSARRVVDLVEIRWNTNFAKGAKLQTTTTLGPDAVWTEAEFPPILSGDTETTFHSASDPGRFFRLVRP